MENKEPIDELFRTKLNDLEADTPYDSWSDIKDQLARSKRKKRMAYWRYSSVAAAVLLAFFSGYFFDSWNITPNRQLKETGRPDIELPESDNGNVVSHDVPDEPSQTGDQTAGSTKSPLEDLPSGQGSNTRNIAEDTQVRKDGTAIANKTRHPERVVQQQQSDQWVASQPQTNDKPRDISPVIDPGNAEDASQTDVTAKPVTLPDYLSPASTSNNIVDSEASPKVKSLSIAQPDEIRLASLDPERSPLPKNSSRVELSFLAGPTVPFMNVNIKEDNPSTQSNIENETLENTYATGLKVLIRNERNWEWQAGLMVNNWIQNSNNVLLTRPDPSSVTNTPNPSTVANSDVSGFTSLGNVKFNQNANNEVSLTEDLSQYYLVPNIGQEYQFVEVPLGAAYYLIDGRFELKLQAGVNTRILSNSHVFLEYPDGSTSDYDALKPNDLSLQLSTGPGFAYRITPRLRLRLDPMIDYSVTPVNRSNNIETYYHQLLFFSGLSYRF